MTTISTAWQHRIKSAQRDLINRCGGIERSAEITSFGKSNVGRWNNPTDPDLMPINAVLALEADAGVALVTSVMASLNGRRLIEPDCQGKDPGSVFGHHAEAVRAAGDLMCAGAQAFADGSRVDIAMFMGVPPSMLGDNSGSDSNWGTGLEQKSLGFVAYTLEDWLTTWEETIGRDLIADDDLETYARFNRAALVKGDLKTRWEAHVKGLQWGVYSPNEIRALEDQNPREGGDVYYDPPNTAGNSDTKKDDGDEPSNPA